MIDLREYQEKVESLDSRLNLKNLCGCQLMEFSQEVSKLAPAWRERLLALIYLESLLLGLVYAHDPMNYWEYIRPPYVRIDVAS
jgi:hypothetical protein